MGIFRSEDIHLCKIAMTKDTCYEAMRALGRLGIVSFVDLNKTAQVFELPFSNEMKRCNETYRSIDNIQSICSRLQVPLKAPATLNEYMMAKDGLANEMHVAEHRLLDVVEKEVRDYDNFLSRQTKSLKEIKEDYNYLREYRDTLIHTYDFLLKVPKRNRDFENSIEGGDRQPQIKEETKTLNNNNSMGELIKSGFQVKIGHLIGTIATIDLLRFEVLVFRGSRGKVLFNSKDIKKNIKNHNDIPRSSFILTFQDGYNIRRKLEMICEGVRAKLFDYPDHDIKGLVEDLGRKILETKNLLRNSNVELRNYLIKLNDLESKRKPGGNSPYYGISTIPLYKMHLLIEEEVYKNMNCLKSYENGNIMFGFIWSRYKTSQILSEMHNKGIFLNELHMEDVDDHDFETPTYFELNEFTSQFQSTVDTYGIPCYKEINPNVFNIVTFPFLFGVMFGDIGHGLILFFIASFVCWFGEKIDGLKSLYNIRYMLLLMGFFSFFCGLMYNDFMSLPLELFKSCYTEKGSDVLIQQDCVYPFGMDPKWYVAHNQLVFMNSLKMKLAIVFGVTHMLLGIFLKSLNAIYNNEFLEYIFEFWPQMIMMSCWFGYMSILIVAKWLTYYKNTNDAPSIVALMIDMFLKMGAVEKVPILAERKVNERINVILLIVSLLCIPIMLLARPIHRIIIGDSTEKKDTSLHGIGSIAHTKSIKKNENKYYQFEDEEDHDAIDKEIKREEQKLEHENFISRHSIRGKTEELKDYESEEYNELDDSPNRMRNKLKKEEKEKNEQDINQLKGVLKIQHKSHTIEEVVVHRLIETIEFTLGTVSNTASYLRLWALSLAHSQLAAVFYEKTMHIGLSKGSPILIFLTQQGFWVATFGVLMCMDSLECFLHTLRLHWVEFQNK